MASTFRWGVAGAATLRPRLDDEQNWTREFRPSV
jgi:hypothetical protein